MSIKNVEKFLNLAKSNENLQKELILINEKLQKEAANEEKIIADNVVPLAKKNGIIFTADDFLHYANEQMSALSEEDLLNVSGGANAKRTAVACLFAGITALSFAAPAVQEFLSGQPTSSAFAGSENQSSGKDSRNTQDKVNTGARHDNKSRTYRKTKVEKENNNENEAQPGKNVAHNDNEASKTNDAEQKNRRDVMQNKNVVLPNNNAKNTPAAPQITVAPPQTNAAKPVAKNNAPTVAPGAVEPAEHVGGNIIDYVPFRRLAISVATQAEHLVNFLRSLPRTSNGLPDLRYVSDETRAKLENDIIHVAKQLRLQNNDYNEKEIIMQGGINPVQKIARENADMLLTLARNILTSQRVTPGLVLEAIKDNILPSDGTQGLPDLDASDAIISGAVKTGLRNLSNDQINSKDSGMSAKDRGMLSALRQKAVAEVKRDAEDSQEKRVTFAPEVKKETTTKNEQKKAKKDDAVKPASKTIDKSAAKKAEGVKPVVPATNEDASKKSVTPTEESKESAKISASGECGANAKWSFDSAGILTISGTGALQEYGYDEEPFPDEIKYSVKRIIIEEGITSLKNFFVFPFVASIDISASLTELNADYFKACHQLESINVNENNTEFKSIDGVLFSKDGTKLLCYPGGKTDPSYTIPTGVTSIDKGAFFASRFLNNLIISSSVSEIGENAVASSEIKSIVSLGDNEPNFGGHASGVNNSIQIFVSNDYNGATFDGIAVTKVEDINAKLAEFSNTGAVGPEEHVEHVGGYVKAADIAEGAGLKETNSQSDENAESAKPEQKAYEKIDRSRTTPQLREISHFYDFLESIEDENKIVDVNAITPETVNDFKDDAQYVVTLLNSNEALRNSFCEGKTNYIKSQLKDHVDVDEADYAKANAWRANTQLEHFVNFSQKYHASPETQEIWEEELDDLNSKIRISGTENNQPVYALFGGDSFWNQTYTNIPQEKLISVKNLAAERNMLASQAEHFNNLEPESERSNNKNVVSAEHDKAVSQTENNLEAFKQIGFKNGDQKYERFDFENGSDTLDLIEHILDYLDNFESLDAESQRGLMLDMIALFEIRKDDEIYKIGLLFDDLNDEDFIKERIRLIGIEINQLDEKAENMNDSYLEMSEQEQEGKKGKKLYEKYKQKLEKKVEKEKEKAYWQETLEKIEKIKAADYLEEENNHSKLWKFYSEKVEPNYENIVKPINDFEELVALNKVEFEKLEDFLDKLAPYINKFDSLDPESKAVLLGYIDNFFYRYSDFIYNKETKADEIKLRADYNEKTQAIVEKMIEIGRNNIFNQGEEKEVGNYKFSKMDYVKAAGATIVFVGAVAAYSIVVNLSTWVDFFFPAQPKKVYDPRQEITTVDKLLADAETKLRNAKNTVTEAAEKAKSSLNEFKNSYERAGAKRGEENRKKIAVIERERSRRTAVADPMDVKKGFRDRGGVSNNNVVYKEKPDISVKEKSNFDEAKYQQDRKIKEVNWANPKESWGHWSKRKFNEVKSSIFGSSKNDVANPPVQPPNNSTLLGAEQKPADRFERDLMNFGDSRLGGDLGTNSTDSSGSFKKE